MGSMFSVCSSLKELDLKSFNTSNVTYMNSMFWGCSNLTDLKFGDNFNTTKVTNMYYMFNGCMSFPEDIWNNLNDVEEIIAFFKKDN